MKLCLFLLITINIFSQSNNTIDSLKIALSKSVNTKQTCELTLQVGILNYKQSNFDTATFYLNKTILLATKFKYDNLILKSYNNLGNIQADKGNNTKALQNYLTALSLANKTNDLKYIAHINKNIGALFLSWKRFDESLMYYNNAIKAAISFNDSLLFADCSNNIGTVYEQQNNYDLAIERYLLALTIYKQYNVLDGVAMAYNNLAIAYKLKNNFTKCVEFNLLSLNISEQLNDKWAQAATLNNIGNLYGQLGDYDKAKTYCFNSLKISRQINAPEITYNVYESLSDAAVKANNFTDAYNYHKQFTLAKDSFTNIENNKQLFDINLKYQSEKKERENLLLKAQNNLKIIAIDKANKQRNLIIIVSLLSLIASIIIYKLHQKTQLAKQLIKQQQLVNQTAFETEQIERTRIARDLHDSVGQKLSVVKMQLSIKNNDTTAASLLLDEAIQDVRTASHNLMPNDLSKGLVIAINEMVEQISYTLTTTTINLTITNTFKNCVLNKQTELYIYRIVQETTNNALKYAQAKNININMDCTLTELHLYLNDDGIGFETTKQFDGIGLQNIKARISQLNGIITLTTQHNKGTSYNIHLPI